MRHHCGTRLPQRAFAYAGLGHADTKIEGRASRVWARSKEFLVCSAIWQAYGGLLIDIFNQLSVN